MPCHAMTSNIVIIIFRVFCKSMQSNNKTATAFKSNGYFLNVRQFVHFSKVQFDCFFLLLFCFIFFAIFSPPFCYSTHLAFLFWFHWIIQQNVYIMLLHLICLMVSFNLPFRLADDGWQIIFVFCFFVYIVTLVLLPFRKVFPIKIDDCMQFLSKKKKKFHWINVHLIFTK